MTLALVRHGQSEGNVAGLIQGWVDAALTAHGRAQAAAVGVRFAGEPIVAIHASTLARAFDTANAIAAHHPLEVEAHPELREHHFGDAEGMSWSDATERWGLQGNWHRRDELIPGIEPTPDFHRRVVSKVEELIDSNHGALAVAVAHGGVIGQVARHVLEIESHVAPRITVNNCSVTLLERGDAGEIVMRTFNDRCHLRSLDPPD